MYINMIKGDEQVKMLLNDWIGKKQAIKGNINL
jgi:hypothetical protein